MKKRHFWTREQIDFLREGCKIFSRVEMIDKLKERFGINVTIRQVYTATDVHKIDCIKTRNVRFLKIGSEKVSSDGYTYVKVDTTGVYKKDWKAKQRVLWEKEYGEIPDGCQIIFVDGDKSNFDLTNLELLTNREVLFLNTSGLMGKDKDLNLTSIQIARLVSKAKSLID